jgi:hypothetical protein
LTERTLWDNCPCILRQQRHRCYDPEKGTPMATAAGLKRKIINRARNLGASLVRFAPVSRWDEFDEVAPDYRPKALWASAETVIVIGVPMLLPVLESTPSINYQEMYNATNSLLDQIGFRLSVWLNDQGHASIFMPRDGYGNLEIVLEKPPAASAIYMPVNTAEWGRSPTVTI